jgi:hypothetical protein
MRAVKSFTYCAFGSFYFKEEDMMNLIKRTAIPFGLCSIAMMFGGCVGAEPGGDTDVSTAGAEPTSEVTSQLASDCENGANGFIDISDTLSGTIQRSVALEFGLTVTLQSGTVSGAQRGWAKISGPTIANDLVWMDWTQNSGSTWLQCGPFSVDGTNLTKTSAAKTTSSLASYQFRACGRPVGGNSHCTSWW